MKQEIKITSIVLKTLEKDNNNIFQVKKRKNFKDNSLNKQ